MDDQLLILLGLLAVAYFLFAPLILILVTISHRKKIRRLEAGLDEVFEQLAAREVEPTPPLAREVTPVPAAPRPEPVKPAEPVAVSPPPEPSPPRPVTMPAMPARVPSTVVQERISATREAVMGPSWTAAVADFLRNVGLFPPGTESGQTRETVLMQWWLPRVGGLMALLSALFFGVYINQTTSPLFKCLELVAVSLGIAGLGRFMERKYTTFGGVLLVTGLIMLYLTSVAAYVLPATRVIENPLLGTVVQALVLALICVVGLLRRSGGIVLLAFHFGYFMAVFMAWEGLREGALIAGALLFAAGAAMSSIKPFRNLSLVVVPGTFVVALAFPAITVVGKLIELPANIPVQVYLNLVVAGIVAQYFVGLFGNQLRARILLSLGTSLSILAVFSYYRILLPDTLQWAVLVLGCTMLVLGLAAWIQRGCGYLFQLLFIKATFLIGVWAILHYAGDLRWIVLALQAVVVAVAARRARVVAMELAVWAVALVSLYYYQSSLSGSLPVALSLTWWLLAAYPGVILAAFAYLLPAYDSPGFSTVAYSRKWPYALIPVTSICLWYYLIDNSVGRTFEVSLPFIIILYATAGLSFIPLLSRWLLLLAAALAFVMSSVLYCMAPFSLLLLMAIVAVGITSVLYLTGRDDAISRLGENGIYLLARVPAFLWILQALNNWPGQAVVIQLVAICLILSGFFKRLRDTGAWFFLPLLVFILTEAPDPSAGLWSTTALSLGLVCLLLPAVIPNLEATLGWGRYKQVWSYLGAALLWIYALKFGDREASWLTGQIVFSLVAFFFMAGSWRWRIPGYFVGALLFAGTVAVRHFQAMLGEAGAYYPWRSEALVSAGLLYAFAMLWFFLKPEPFRIAKPGNMRQFEWMSSGMGGILFFLTSVVTFRYVEIGWMSWYTPLLALTAFFMIFLGLFRVDKTYRYLGLAALLIPLGRLFLVDVKDVLHRIIAFAAAAVVLTLLGYLYHRLSTKDEGPQTGDADP